MPRKERYAVSKDVVQAIRNKREKILYGPYSCPKCGLDKCRIRINKVEKKVEAICSCDLKFELKYKEGYAGADYFNDLIDNYKTV